MPSFLHRFPLSALLPGLVSALAIASAEDAKSAEPAKSEPAAAAAPPAADAKENKVVIGVLPAVMQYDKKEFTVKAGEKVAILFINKACPLQHNLIILKPGTDAAYGAAADKLIQSDAAAALAKRYAPDDPASLASVIAASTKLIGPGQNEVIKFTAPETPGDYPYLCTFPGHRFLMKGVMKVVK
jgi:azurin